MKNLAQLGVMSTNVQVIQYEALRWKALRQEILLEKSQADALVNYPGMR